MATEFNQALSYREGFIEAVMFAFSKGEDLLVEHRLEVDPPEPFIPNGKIEMRDRYGGDSVDYKEVALKREIDEEFQGRIEPLEYELISEYPVEEIRVIFYIYLINNWSGEFPEYSVEEGEKSAILEWKTASEAKTLFKYPVLTHAVELIEQKNVTGRD
jgi:hypothetical protein